MQGTLLHVSSSSLIVRVCICLNMCLFVCLCLFRELFALLEVVGLPKLHKMCVCDDGMCLKPKIQKKNARTVNAQERNAEISTI